eukprot:g83161.t1
MQAAVPRDRDRPALLCISLRDQSYILISSYFSGLTRHFQGSGSNSSFGFPFRVATTVESLALALERASPSFLDFRSEDEGKKK